MDDPALSFNERKAGGILTGVEKGVKQIPNKNGSFWRFWGYIFE